MRFIFSWETVLILERINKRYMETTIILAVIGIVGLGLIAAIANKVKKAVDVAAPIISALSEGLEDQEREIEMNPKSVNAMTSVYLPRIEADFPDFNYYEFRTKAENMIKSAFESISTERIEVLQNASKDLRYQISNIINRNRDRERIEKFINVKIHQTEIKNYVKSGGTCKITLQSSVAYNHFYKNKSGAIIEGSDTFTVQTRYDTELIYIQDIDKVESSDSAIGTNCPNCGAPIKGLGSKSCPYCGSGITEINIHTWVINSFEET